MEVWWPPIKVNFTPFINMTLRVFEAFSGVGSQSMALRNLGIDYEVVATSDVDEFAVKSYAAIHDNDKEVSQVSDEEMQDYLEKRNIPLNDKGVRKILKGNKLKEFYEACVKSNNLGDISKVVTQDIPDHDLFTYSFPCQDISAAGKGLGLDEGSDTRSSLLWECQKVIAVKKPKYLLLENVKNLVGKKHKHNFDKWLEWLEDQGYKSYWQILNAKDYGVPQNRERVFVVSILGEHEPYEFPGPIELELRLKDILESEVDEKFYLTEVQTERLIQSSDYLRDLTNEPKINILAHRKSYRRNTQVFDPNGITETLDTGQGGGRGHYTIGVKMNRNEVKGEQDISRTLLARDYKGFGNQDMNGVVDVFPEGIPIKNATKKGYIEAHDGDGVNLAYPDSKTRRGRVQKGLSQTLDTSDNKGVVIGASRGRNPENPSDRTVGSPTEQRLEINKPGTSNTITTVQKDNYVVEGMSDKFSFVKRKSREIIAEKGSLPEYYNPYNKSEILDIAPTITTNSDRASNSGQVMINKNFRIRKLTPKECWRLMGFSDDDFHKAEEVNSNTQLYKQAGNSIVVDVLEGTFKQLLEVAE